MSVTKLCPYCAEEIKAAAIRCRWCGSDLPDEQPAAEPPAEAVPTAVTEDPVAPADDADRVGWPLWLVTGLVAFALVLAGTVLVRQLLAQDDWTDVPEGTTPLAAGAVVQSPEAKRAAMMAATAATERVLSYDAASFDRDTEAALAVLDGQMEEQYSSTMDAIRDKTVENGARVEASVVAVSAISATEHDARVLLFVNQQTTGKHLDQPRVDLNRVVVTIHRGEGDWTITKLDAL